MAENPSSTHQNPLDQQRNGHFHSDDESEQSLLGRPSKPTQPIKLAPIGSHNEHRPPATNLIDINAMSIASIYDQENNDIMDADIDIYNDVSFSKPSAWAGQERDSVIESIPQEDAVTVEMDSSINNKTHTNNYDNCYASHSNVNGGQAKSLCLSDGIRSIDFILACHKSDDPEQELHSIKRKIFEQNLVNEGLVLEHDTFESIHCTKIHAPTEVLRRYSEILKLRLPMKTIPAFKDIQSSTASVFGSIRRMILSTTKTISVDEEYFPTLSTRFTAIYSRDKEYLFDIDHPDFFTEAIRSRIVNFILDRKPFILDKCDEYAFGIGRLINDGTYMAAYPLHDGEITQEGSKRHLLYNEWASVGKWYRCQPLDYVKEYFGVKIGLYFAWLGYYTYMLLLASLVGVCCFIYAVSTINADIPSQEICSGVLNVTMCPLCDQKCDYWPLSQACMHVKVTYLFDNPATVFFAVFMSFWAVLFLELWKRYSAGITHRWDLTGFDTHEEHPRPQYLARLAHVKNVRIDYITNTQEPDPPFWRMTLPAALFSFSIVLLLVALALAAVLGVVLYRMSVMASLSVYDDLATSYAIYITTITAAVINLALIFVFSWFYNWLAECLTEYEVLRTQTEFDDSLTLKIYLFQFVNYYASIFYIAFFKGKFIGHPGKYNRFFDYRQEECGLGGCLTELCIQLAIIMIGKQAMNTVLEMVLPRLYKYYNTIGVKLTRKRRRSSMVQSQRWVRDLKLIEWGPQSLFNEYLEMVLQYGFVTIFVAAFPLAPFFALLNNVLEMRFDAKKLLQFHRRPVTQRVRDIGVWYRILDCIGKLSVITNGFIIAFTSEFIPRLVYRIYESKDGSLTGYVNHSLSYFNTTDFTKTTMPKWPAMSYETCRYPDYRSPPGDKHQYEHTYLYWCILAARLCFVLVFENVVAVVMILVRWAIPDMPAELRDKIRREAYITNEIIIKQEAERAKRLANVRSWPNIDDIRPGQTEPEDSVKEQRMRQLMSSNLSESQLDLVIYHADDPVAPGNCPPVTQTQSTKLNNLFMESERGVINKMHNHSVKNDGGEEETETSQL